MQQHAARLSPHTRLQQLVASDLTRSFCTTPACGLRVGTGAVDCGGTLLLWLASTAVAFVGYVFGDCC
jgi:hypothetical protein